MPTPMKSLWLTFDDGPHKTNTPKVLTALQAHGIKAVFFMIGDNAKAEPATAKAVFDQGHVIANHTMTHDKDHPSDSKFLTKLTRDQVRKEVQDADAVLRGYASYKKWVRPPRNDCDANVKKWIETELSYELLSYNIDSNDWSDPINWKKNVLDGLRTFPGDQACVLMHDIKNHTSQGLSDLLTDIKALNKFNFANPVDLPNAPIHYHY